MTRRLLVNLTTTIRREFLVQILKREKKIEYREMKPYWTQRLESIETPFTLRLINGYYERAPEATVLIWKIRRNHVDGEYELHIKKILRKKYCSKAWMNKPL